MARWTGYLKFHRANKIVIRLGLIKAMNETYHEVLGVGQKQWNDFDLHRYASASDDEKRQALRNCVNQVLQWIQVTSMTRTLLTKQEARLLGWANGRRSGR